MSAETLHRAADKMRERLKLLGGSILATDGPTKGLEKQYRAAQMFLRADRVQLGQRGDAGETAAVDGGERPGRAQSIPAAQAIRLVSDQE